MPNIVALMRDMNLTGSDTAVFTLAVSVADNTWSSLMEIAVTDLSRSAAALNRDIAQQVSALVNAAVGLATAESDVRLIPEHRLITHPRKPFSFQKNPGSAAIAAHGTGTFPTTTGTDAHVSDATGQYIKYTSAATTNSLAGWSVNGMALTSANVYRFALVFKTPAILTSYRLWAGLSSNSGAESSDTPALKLAAFRYSTSAADPGFMMVTSDGTTQTTTNTGIAIAADTRYEVEIDATVAGEISFHIVNRGFSGTITTNLPAVTENMFPTLNARTLTNAAREILISHMRGETL